MSFRFRGTMGDIFLMAAVRCAAGKNFPFRN